MTSIQITVAELPDTESVFRAGFGGIPGPFSITIGYDDYVSGTIHYDAATSVFVNWENMTVIIRRYGFKRTIKADDITVEAIE